MAQILPLVPSVAFYTFSTSLDGVPFTFDVRWNGRDAAWYLSISDEDQQLIAAGIKIVLGTILGKRVTSSRMPAGALVALDATGKGRDAGFDDLGTRVAVLYLTTAEVEAIRNG